MDLNFDILVITFIGSSALAVILAAFKDTWLSWFQHKLATNTKAKHLLARRLDVYDVLNQLKNRVHSPRALVQYTENGGGLPVPGSPLYISILYETTDHNTSSIKEDIQRLLTDESYDNMLSHLATKGTNFIETDELGEGMLKKFFKFYNVESSIVVPITSSKRRFYFLTLTWNEKKTMEELQELELEIIIASNKIKSLIEGK